MDPMQHWLEQLIDGPAMRQAATILGEGRRVVATGLWGSSGHLAAGAVARRLDRPVLLIVAHLDDADEAVDDLALVDPLDAVALPALEVMPGESNVSLELLAERLALVRRLIDGDQPRVIVAPIQALMQAVPEQQAMGRMIRRIDPGDTVDLGELGGWLTEVGYSRVEAVGQPGEFAMRGGIIDVFAPGQTAPVRIDLFGDEVDTPSEFDIDSMGSTRKLETVNLVGAGTEQMQDIEHTTSFWSLLSDQTVFVLHEPLEVAEQGRGYYERLSDARGIYASAAVLKAANARPCLEINQFGGLADEPDVRLPVRQLHHFADQAGEAIAELAAFAAGDQEHQAHQVVVVCQKPAERERMEQLIAEHAPEAADRIALELGYLYRGFIWGGDLDADADGRPLMVVPHHELFHRYATRRRLRRVSSPLSAGGAESFFDLEVGDRVVHADHGIAIFRGLRSMEKAGKAEEYLTLEFAYRALLHVPSSQIELISKYIGGFAGRPPLSKLGGKRWKKQKADVADAVKDLAAELLRVQAARSSLSGINFPEDSSWMKQFEEEFPYEETDDQLAAIAEAKRDMMGQKPMDRLICGDVGFGKTEIAIRAAFKAVEADRQVAVLCPTTVLCEQHERTFGQRMADYPVRVESLSRFKTGAEARAILAELAAGQIDIVIGTHRLLSEDVAFKDLGLVVIDEEQRFGVEHKNKLMRFRVTVDVLTMSATPIPRTLHMALLGLRDISSLSTPPADRRAIVTEVIPYDRQRIRQALLRELNRGGQAYFVHNRVHNIHAVANEVRSLVPEARVIVGHGQMKPRELEHVMLQFINGQADVLVCTTIIESGIDIPTANTMFITEADHFGLAELHQLRGRVGRYKHRAYCYLLLPETRTLSEVASKRLRAIEQYAMLGAGFKIAMRDMEIRGVGNIIGPEQSGHIATVGYQMYCHLLEQATARLKAEPAPKLGGAHVEIGVGGLIPRNFMPSDKHRMEAYRRIHQAESLASLDEVERDLTDAFGPLPEPAQMLVELARIRLGLGEIGVEAMKLHDADLIFTTRHVRAVYERLEDAPGSVRIVDPPSADQPGTVYFRPPANYLQTKPTLLAVLRKLFVRPVRTEEAQAAAAQA